MKMRIPHFLGLVAGLAFSLASASAQTFESSGTKSMPFMRFGVYAGRSGTSLGQAGVFEVNPLWHRQIGFYALISHSSISTESHGALASNHDVWAGAGVTFHAPPLAGFFFSPFFQTGCSENHNRALFPDGDGGFVRAGHGNDLYLATAGTEISREIRHSFVRWAVRLGKNIEAGPADHTAGGIYMMGGVVLENPVQQIRKMF
jgi:hypothetical protein